MNSRQHYQGEPIMDPYTALARYHVEELYRQAEQHRFVRALRASQARAQSQAAAPRRRLPRWWTALLPTATRST